MSPSLRAVRAFALYDLAATAAFAIPVVGEHVLALLLSGFGLFGSMSDWLPLPVTTALFLHLTGILGVLWNRWRAYSLDPQVIRERITPSPTSPPRHTRGRTPAPPHPAPRPPA